MTLRHHDLDVYPVTLHAAYSVEDWAELRNTIDSLAENIEARGHTSRDAVARDDGDEDCHVSIYVDPRHDTTDVIRTITHESVHAAGAVFDQIVAPIEPFSEPFAYLTDYIAGWLWDGLPPRAHDAKDTR